MRREGGFTILELIITTSILVLVVLSGTWLFRTCLDSWERESHLLNGLYEIRAAQEIIISDLRAVFISPLEEDEPILSGESEWIELLTLPGSSILRVRYFLDGDRLMRKRATNPFLKQGSESIDVVATRVESILFEYHNARSWQGDWRSPTSLPRAVRMKMRLMDQQSPISITVWIPPSG
jgi:type II secretory pathway component PulJ